jgi:hypothetical protein
VGSRRSLVELVREEEEWEETGDEEGQGVARGCARYQTASGQIGVFGGEYHGARYPGRYSTIRTFVSSDI